MADLNLLNELLSLDSKDQLDEDLHFSKAKMGQRGDMLVLDDTNPMIGKIAKALGVHDGWNLKKITNGLFAAYNSGDRLSFFTSEDDFVEDED